MKTQNIFLQDEIITFAHKKYGQIRTVCIDKELWIMVNDVIAILLPNCQERNKIIRDCIKSEDKRAAEIVISKKKSNYGAIINKSGLDDLFNKADIGTDVNIKGFYEWILSEIFKEEKQEDNKMKDEQNKTEVLNEIKNRRESRMMNKKNNDLVKVNDTDISVIEWKRQRVITTALLAKIYEASVDNVKKNFNRHKDNFIEGVHYFLLQGKELREFKRVVTNSHLPIDDSLKFTSQLYLWTERGANRHCKILDTDKAWEQFDNLEEVYFKVKDNTETFVIPKDYSSALRALADEIDKNQLLKKENEELQEEVIYKEDVIVGLVDNISIADKRQILNRVVRHGKVNYQERWNVLYREFENKYHINLQRRFDTYNKNNEKPCKNKLEYIDRVMQKLPELYEIAVKLYENDIKELIDEMYEINRSDEIHIK